MRNPLRTSESEVSANAAIAGPTTGHAVTPGETEPPPPTVTPPLSTRISAETRSGA